MRKFILSVTVAFLLLMLFSPILLANEVRTPHRIELYDAYRRGIVRVQALPTDGYSQFRMMIENRTKEPLVIDPSGSYLQPNNHFYQRVGLGPRLVKAEKPNALDSLINLAARKRWIGDIGSVCMDSVKETPASRVRYTLVPNRSPKHVYEALKYWSRNPHIAQSKVNDVVWKHSSLAELRKNVNETDHPWKKKVSLVTDQGALFWICPERKLYFLESAGSDWERIGQSIDRLAVGHGRVISYSPKRKGMKTYDFSKRRWVTHRLPIRPRQILPAADGTILALAEEGGLYYRNPKTDRYHRIGTEDLNSVRVVSSQGNPVAFTISRQVGCLYSAGRFANSLKQSRCSGIEAIDTSDRCLYARNRSHILFHSDRWRRVEDASWEFVTGRSVCYLVRGTEVRRFSENKRRVATLPTAPENLFSLTVDRETDDLMGVDEKGRVWGVGSGDWYELCRVPGMEHNAVEVARRAE